jgi:hypothetical protein
MSELPGRPYDLIYSFYSLGFHWSLEPFLDELLGLMHDRSLAVFTLSTEFKPFMTLGQIHHRIVRQADLYPGQRLRMIPLSKTDLFPDLPVEQALIRPSDTLVRSPDLG